MPDNQSLDRVKQDFQYNVRDYGKSFKAWQQFIALSRKGESIAYRTPEGDISSPAHVKKLVEDELQNLRQQLAREVEQKMLEALIQELGNCCDYCGLWHDPKEKHGTAQTFNERIFELEAKLKASKELGTE